MTEVGELRVRIENAARNIMEDYDRTLKTVGKLKEKMNELEQRMSQKRPEEVEEDMYHLRHATERLNRLTDSQILKSKKVGLKEISDFCCFPENGGPLCIYRL